MKRLNFFRKPNFWIPATLLVANMAACLLFVLFRPPEASCPVRDPVRDEEVVNLLEHIRSGDRAGETWTITLTEQEAEETITWYLQRYPQIPFAHPCVEITPDYIGGEGDVLLGGLRIHVGGKARITLADGLPVVEILELSIPLPGGIEAAVEAEVQRQLKRADLLPVRFTAAEWNEDVVVVEGYVR